MTMEDPCWQDDRELGRHFGIGTLPQSTGRSIVGQCYAVNDGLALRSNPALIYDLWMLQRKLVSGSGMQVYRSAMKGTAELAKIKASRVPTNNACTLALTRNRFVSQPVAWAWNNTSSKQAVTTIAGQVRW